MMSLAHLYTDFGSSSDTADTDAMLGSEEVESEKLESFEKGYQAGWDDSVKAHETAKERLSADFAQNLQEMSFTYHEAAAKLLVSLQPLLKMMLTKVLPELASASLGAHVQEQLGKMAKDQMSSALEIVVAPENYEALQALIEASEISIPFEVRSEPSLGGGQVYLRSSNRESEIDLDGVLRGISEAVNAFFHQSNKDLAND